MKLLARLWATIALLSFVLFAGGCFGGCDFDWGECGSDADCPGDEVCASGWFVANCIEPDCLEDNDCFCGEVCFEGFCEIDELDENPCPPEPECKAAEDFCVFDSDCCSGVCGELESCEPEPFPFCVAEGQSCSEQDACCNGVCADGVCAAQKCQSSGEPQVVADGLSALALGEDAGALYWVSDGALHSIAKVGGEPTLLASGVGAGSCISRFGNRTTWCGDGGEILQLIDGDEAPALVALATPPVSALIDSEAGLFWSEASGAIMAAPAPLPSPPQLLATAVSGSPPIAVDASSLFFADGVTVNAIPVGGGVVSMLFTGAGPIAALAEDEESLYFVDAGAMTALSKAGGAPSSIGFAESARIIALSVTHVFYADTFIARIPKGGGDTVALVNAVEPPSLLVDDQCVYWVDSAEGRIMKRAKN